MEETTQREKESTAPSLASGCSADDSTTQLSDAERIGKYHQDIVLRIKFDAVNEGFVGMISGLHDALLNEYKTELLDVLEKLANQLRNDKFPFRHK